MTSRVRWSHVGLPAWGNGMPERVGFDHLLVTERVVPEVRKGRGGGSFSVRAVDRVTHGQQMLAEAQAAIQATEGRREQVLLDEELRAVGTVLVLEGAEANFGIRLDSLTRMTRSRKVQKKPQWLLLAAREATDGSPQQATIWVADEFRSRFLCLFEDYLNEEKDSDSGNPRNHRLVANTTRIREAFLADLWTSTGSPPTDDAWWELWIDATRSGVELLSKIATALNLELLDTRTRVGNSLIVYAWARWQELEPLVATALPLTEIRRPSFVDTVEDLSEEERVEYVADLAQRVQAAPLEAPTVCHLDTGVFRGHLLLADSLPSEDQHTVVGSDGHDSHGHGTSMAGLALYGDHLDDYLTGTSSIVLRHRLESVKVLTEGKDKTGSPRDYASTTIQAVSLPEITAGPRRRAYCMPISAAPDGDPGAPTLWSAAVDALAFGTDIAVEDDSVSLISTPDASAARLIVVSAANVNDYRADHLGNSDLSSIEDPGQAWNALTVGAYTDKSRTPRDPDYRGYTPLAEPGELSPHSRTSLLFGDRPWPIKPEICMEGGNVLTDGNEMFEPKHPLLSLRSTGHTQDADLVSANATSAATAQAARLAALAMDRYPGYWPETVRGLLVHEARWTPAMQVHLDARRTNKTERARMLRRYGWGVPTEDSVLRSSGEAVTMVVQDEFAPFDREWKARSLRLHDLPWPRKVLQDLGEGVVTVRITLSYFVEPSATRRGWIGKYTYRSHGLRFDLQGSLETTDQFVARVNREAQGEEDGTSAERSGEASRWFLGEQARNHGSLHQDEWAGTATELAECNHIAVYPVGGWWKNNTRKDREELPVRYALLVSLRTEEQGVDLYTPIATQLGVVVPGGLVEV